jgi:DNA invertase Pin-like site-specific DNA recombinase
MIIGYAKLAAPQSAVALNEVRTRLHEAGAETLFIDCDLPWNSEQPDNGVDTALAACRPGDVLVTPSPAQLADSIAGMIAVAAQLTARQATLRVIEIAGGQMLDTGTPAGAMMLGALGLMAAFEKPRAEADASAYAAMPRRPRGRPPTATTKADEIARLRSAGMSAVDIANRLNICRASVYRVLTLGASNHPMPPAERKLASPATPGAFPPVRRYEVAG